MHLAKPLVFTQVPPFLQKSGEQSYCVLSSQYLPKYPTKHEHLYWGSVLNKIKGTHKASFWQGRDAHGFICSHKYPVNWLLHSHLANVGPII